MPRIALSELPEDLRVKLTDKGTKELWHRVDEFGGIKTLSNSFEFSQSKMYNWKNKDLALPLKFVKTLMGQNSTDEIKMLKGPGSSGKIKKPIIPFNISNELLTRIQHSVKPNKNGTPIYITPEKTLAKRFTQLLQKLGKVDYKIYSRENRFEVRYPKFLHETLANQNFKTHRPALIDEKGKIQNGKIHVENTEIPVKQFNKKLYSRQKTFEIALEKGNTKKITELMAEESNKVKKMLEN